MPKHRDEQLNWRQAWTLYRRELRGALRERNIVLNSILLPLFLYPFILWALLTGLTFVQGQTQDLLSRVAIPRWPAGHPGLRHAFEANQQTTLVPSISTEVARQQILEGKLDAFLDIEAGDKVSAKATNFQVRILFNESKERSLTARERAVELIETYRQQWLRREAKARGISDGGWEQFEISARNVASGKQMGSFFLGMLLPILFVVMMAVGCFYPAVDSTAGERERNTWETLMCSSISRRSVVAGKYLYVLTMGAMAGLLNMTAMILTVKPLFEPLLARAGERLDFTLPLHAIPFLIAGTFLLAAFVGGTMMLFAAFARTFKEGQAMITPFYLCIMLPMMFLQVPGLKFSLPFSWIPVINVTLMIRAAVSGSLEWAPVVVTIAVSLLLIFVVIRLAAFVLQFEDVVMGSYSGSLLRLLKERVLSRRAPASLASP